MEIETTYRVIDLSDKNNVGQTAATPELAKLAAGGVGRVPTSRFAIEMTDWADDWGKPKIRRSVITEAEAPNQPWKLGV
jgi:hypothetical protein